MQLVELDEMFSDLEISLNCASVETTIRAVMSSCFSELGVLETGISEKSRF